MKGIFLAAVVFVSIVNIPFSAPLQMLLSSVLLFIFLAINYKQLPTSITIVDTMFFTLIIYWSVLVFIKINPSFSLYKISIWGLSFIIYFLLRKRNNYHELIPKLIIVSIWLALIPISTNYIYSNYIIVKNLNFKYKVPRSLFMDTFNSNDNYIISYLTMLMPFCILCFKEKFLYYTSKLAIVLIIAITFMGTSASNKIIVTLFLTYLVLKYLFRKIDMRIKVISISHNFINNIILCFRC